MNRRLQESAGSHRPGRREPIHAASRPDRTCGRTRAIPTYPNRSVPVDPDSQLLNPVSMEGDVRTRIVRPVSYSVAVVLSSTPTLSYCTKHPVPIYHIVTFFDGVAAFTRHYDTIRLEEILMWIGREFRYIIIEYKYTLGRN